MYYWTAWIQNISNASSRHIQRAAGILIGSTKAHSPREWRAERARQIVEWTQSKKLTGHIRSYAVAFVACRTDAYRTCSNRIGSKARFIIIFAATSRRPTHGDLFFIPVDQFSSLLKLQFFVTLLLLLENTQQLRLAQIQACNKSERINKNNVGSGETTEILRFGLRL